MDYLWRHLQTILVLLPLVGAGTLCLVRGRSAIRWTAFGFLCAAVPLAVATGWVAPVDGLAWPLVVLTTYVCLAAGLASWSASYAPRVHFILLLCLEAGFVGTLVARSFVSFFIWFEMSIVPLGWMIENWHGSTRPYAASKAVVYKLCGSVALLIVGISLNRSVGTMELGALATAKSHVAIGQLAGPFLVLASIAFLIRMGAFPFHNWLADLQAQSPPPVAMMLAGLVPMTGGYGMLRIGLAIFPGAAVSYRLVGVGLGLAGIIYGGACALASKDFQRRVAYTTICNLGFAVLGMGIMNYAALCGAVYVLLSQGVIGAMLVLASNADEDDFGGLAVFASIGIPGLCAFVGEFLVLLGVFQSRLPSVQVVIIAVVASVGGVVNAGALIRGLRASNEEGGEVEARQRVALILLSVGTVLLGVFPAEILSVIGPTVAGIARELSPM